jgi:hypothetical protein
MRFVAEWARGPCDIARHEKFMRAEGAGFREKYFHVLLGTFFAKIAGPNAREECLILA